MPAAAGCTVQVQVRQDGEVNIVHVESGSPFKRLDSAHTFRVRWDGSSSTLPFPTTSNGCGSGCMVHGATCLCETRVVQERVFAARRGVWELIEGSVLATTIASHLDDDGIDEGLSSVTAEEFNRQADHLATDAVELHNLPPPLVEAAKERHRLAVVLHTVAVAIYDKRHRTRPLPHRQAGFSSAQLAKMDQNPRLGGGGSSA